LPAEPPAPRQANCTSQSLNRLVRKPLELGEAAAIYQQHRNHHGLGSVHLNHGYLHLDNGDLELADTEAKTAFRLGEEKKDCILMARARLLNA
jgi:hypothetical protein